MAKGRIVVVTGAAGGIGSAVVARFRAGGDLVVAVDRDAEKLSRLAADGVQTVLLDITREEDCCEVSRDLTSRFGGLDVLVHAAGWFPIQPLDGLTAADFRQVVDVNLTGAFLAVSAFWPLMKGRGGGRVVLVGSASTFEGVPEQIPYVAAKAGLFGLARSMAKPLGAEGVTINVVTPGLTSTPPVLAEMDAEMIQASAKARAIGREEHPDDLAGPIHFLASAEAAFISGQTINVDGGKHMT